MNTPTTSSGRIAASVLVAALAAVGLPGAEPDRAKVLELQKRVAECHEKKD